MSGLPRKYPGVWQSWQLAMVPRYLPRATTVGSAATAVDDEAARAMAAQAANEMRCVTEVPPRQLSITHGRVDDTPRHGRRRAGPQRPHSADRAAVQCRRLRRPGRRADLGQLCAGPGRATAGPAGRLR